MLVDRWKIDVESKPKLRTYTTFKRKLELEPYLLSKKDKKVRYLMTSRVPTDVLIGKDIGNQGKLKKTGFVSVV